MKVMEKYASSPTPSQIQGIWSTRGCIILQANLVIPRKRLSIDLPWIGKCSSQLNGELGEVRDEKKKCNRVLIGGIL
jgi:hypothetical protein